MHDLDDALRQKTLVIINVDKVHVIVGKITKQQVASTLNETRLIQTISKMKVVNTPFI